LLPWVGFWTLLGLAFATQLYLSERRLSEHALRWWEAVRTSLPDWYVWGVFALVIARLTQRLPITRVSWGFDFAFHVAASLLVALGHLAIAVPLQWALRAMVGQPYPLMTKFVDNFAGSYLWNVVVYWGILAGAHAREYHKDREAHRLRAARLEAKLAQAKLQALTLELRPHFLFNALNTLAELIHEDPDAAERMVQRLGELLRRTLETDGAREVPLERELALAEGYLSVEAVRFQDRLVVDYDVAADTRAGSVPAMILLPLIENAVRHGLARRADGGRGRVGIRARRAADRLELEIWDDGPGLAEGGEGRQGIGLANTRARLEHLYGTTSTLELLSRQPTGVTVKLVLPFRAAA
jgi:signal transduction histidine kinase